MSTVCTAENALLCTITALDTGIGVDGCWGSSALDVTSNNTTTTTLGTATTCTCLWAGSVSGAASAPQSILLGYSGQVVTALSSESTEYT